MLSKTLDITRAVEIVGWMTEEELLWLAEQAAEHSVIVEMGSYQGRSTRAMGDHAKGIVYAWDNWEGPDEAWWRDVTPDSYRKSLLTRFKSNLSDLLESGKVQIINMSHDQPVPEIIGKPDMIFIDGDHTYEAVKRDIKKWLPLPSGCLLCGHDFNQPEVRQAVQELLPIKQAAAGTIWSFTA